jgi:hypothetical protein
MMFPGLDIRIPPMTACGLIIQRVEFMNLAHIPMFVHVKKKSVSCTTIIHSKLGYGQLTMGCKVVEVLLYIERCH